MSRCRDFEVVGAVSSPDTLPFPTETVSGLEAAQSALATGAPVAARSFRDPLIGGGGFGPEMVAIPTGEFIMGSPMTDKRRPVDDETQHRVLIAYRLAVGKYPVTVHDYLTCVAASACRPPEWQETNRPVDPLAPTDPYARLGDSVNAAANPIVGISWTDAKAYTAWLSRTTGQSYRLLTEAEWEYAARAGSTTVYPWGDKIGVGRANCYGCGSRWDSKTTSPVGSFAPNAFGLYDMNGNVTEWVEDCFETYSPAHPSDGSAFVKTGCFVRVTRGGSYSDWVGELRTASRSIREEGNRTPDLGFRVARRL
ncbi:MAG: formylglycine-generating enzyme family protein [Asticcacaulis sp.]